jgi:nucleoid-associated protein YgaU
VVTPTVVPNNHPPVGSSARPPAGSGTVEGGTGLKADKSPPTSAITGPTRVRVAPPAAGNTRSEPAPASIPDQPAATNSQGTYTVVRGDNLWAIARAQLGHAPGAKLSAHDTYHVTKYWAKLLRANGQLRNPNHIEPGWQITLPPV